MCKELKMFYNTLEIDSTLRHMRLTKIICTLGPATNSLEGIQSLAESGMNIARINFSHGTTDSHRTTIRTIQSVQRTGRCIAIMMDTKGSEIRTGDLAEPLSVKPGEEVLFSPLPLSNETLPVLQVNYAEFSQDVVDADRILLDNGELSFELVRVREDGVVVAKAREAGTIGSRRHINLPGANVQLPSVTDKDWEDIAMGIEEGVDFVALSFIQTGNAVREVKKFLRENGSTIQVISKIESKKAVENFDDILEASDGIMVARGDLGAEIPFELVPAIQDDIVRRCREAGKPVIVATHMLESMTQHPMPTRAEATDVAHAAVTRSDCTMLSGETAAGNNPLASLDAMDRILRETEKHLPMLAPGERVCAVSEYTARAQAAAIMALALQAPAIVVLTRTGRSAESISQLRPTLPILALTDSENVRRAMQILYGVLPLQIEFSDDPETTVEAALQAIRSHGLVKSGQRIVIVSDTKTNTGLASSVQMRTMP